MKTQHGRIRRTVILGVLWLVSIGLLLFLLPSQYRSKLDFHLLPYWIGCCTVFPLVYGLGGALFFSILAVWCDFRLKSRTVRAILLTAGLVIILLYPIVLFGTGWTVFHVWIWENPFFFVIPGGLLFCGFNKKPSEKTPENEPTPEKQSTK